MDPRRPGQGSPTARTAPPIAHGYLTLSLIPLLGSRIFRVDGDADGRQLRRQQAAVPPSRHRRLPDPGRRHARQRRRHSSAGVQAVVRYTIEIEGQDKPACVAETVRILVP